MGVVGPRTGLDAINTLCIERYSEDIMQRSRCTKLIVTIAFHKGILALRACQVDIKLWTVMSHAIVAYTFPFACKVARETVLVIGGT